MATDIVGSLFGVTPEVLQQRQMEMADRQAMEYAQLSPLQRASYGLARGGYQLAGALGGQDPQLRMISNRNAIARQIDPTDPQSMMRGIQALQQAGDQVGAMQLAQVLRQAENDMALRSQRQAAATASLAAATRERSQTVPTSIQEADRISQLTQALQNPELSPYERMGLEAALQQLRKTSTSDSIAVATRIGDLTRALADPNIPELDRRVLQAQYDQLTKAAGQKPNVPDAIQIAEHIGVLTKQLQNPELAPVERMALEAKLTQLRKTEKESATTAELTNARALAELAGPVGSPAYNAEFRAQLARLTTKAEGKESTTNEVTNARTLAALAGPVGSEEYNAEFRAQLARLTAKPEGREPTTPELTNARAVAARAGAPGSPEYEAAFKAEYDRLTGPKEPKPPTTPELTNARAIALQAGVEGSPEFNAAFVAEYNRLTQKEAQKPEIARLQALRDSLPTGSQARKEVQDRIDALGKGSTTSITNVNPGQRQLADIPAFRRSVQSTIDPQLKSIDAADQALQAIDDSIKTNNFVSFNAARVQLAKALGDSQLSRRDVEQAGGDPSLIGGLYDATSRLFTGTPSIDTQNKIKSTLNAIRMVAAKKAQAEVDTQRRIALQTPGYEPAAVDRALSFPQLQQRTTASGAGSLAEQAKAELERRRQAGGR